MKHAIPDRPVRRKLLTGLSYAAMMSLAIGLNLLPVFLTSIKYSFGGSEGLSGEELGRLGAFAFAGLVVGILLTGPLADRFGAKPFAILGNVLTVVGLAGMSLSQNYIMLLAMIGLIGLGAGVLDMILSPVVAALNPESRSSAMNWLHSFYAVGAVVTILIATLALAAGLGWRTVCWLVMPLPLFLIVSFIPLRFPPMITDQGRIQFRVLVKKSGFLIALAAIFLGGATELGLAQWLPAYAELSLGFSKEVAGTGLLLFSIAMALGRMVIGAAGNRICPYQAMGWGCVLSVILFLGGAFLPSGGWALACCVLAGFTGSCLWPTMLAVTADRYPAGGATMFGALAALGNAGGIFMPWVVGAVADWHSLSLGIATSAIAPLLMLFLVLELARRR